MDRAVSGYARRIDLSDLAPLKIGRAAIDPAAHEARYDGKVERLQPQTLKVLVALSRRTGEVVTRGELIDSCWDGRFVSDDVINRSILLARGLASRAGGFAIETVPKSGYRLIDQAPSPRRRLALAAALVAALAGLALVAALRSGSSPEPVPPTVALLPFNSGIDTGSRNLAAASTDSVSHMLLDNGQAVRLAWPPTAAETNTADLIIGGDVRPAGAGFTAVVQLRDRASGVVLLSRQYAIDATQASRLPGRIGAELAATLSGTLAMKVLDRRKPLDPSLANALLKHVALGYFDEDLSASYPLARRVAASAPDSVMAQLSLAYDSGFILAQLPMDQRAAALRDGRRAADRAKTLAPDYGDAYVPWCQLHPPARLADCEDQLRIGIKVDRDAPFTPLFLSGILARAGRLREALPLARIALASDRYNPNKLGLLERMLILNGETAEADRLFREAEAVWPNHSNLHWARVDGFILTGDLNRAEQALGQVPPDIELVDRHGTALLFEAYRRRDWAAVRRTCGAAGADRSVQRLCLVALRPTGDRDLAFRLIDGMYPRIALPSRAEEERVWLANPMVGRDPLLAAPALAWLRADPRFAEAADRIGLMRYWKSGRKPDFCAGRREPLCAEIAAG